MISMNNMDIYELIRKLRLPYEISNKIIKLIKENDFKKYQILINELITLEASIDTFNKIKEEANNQEDYILIIYLFASLKTYQKYLKKGIDEDIFIDTMKCFSRFINESYMRNGKYIFDRGWWTYRQTNMTLFRIGELEYEFIIENNERIVSIHIPSDANFSNDYVDVSLNKCKDFIKKYYPEYINAKFICDSWLLSPILKEVLPLKSNILSFQQRFNIINFNSEERDFIIWIYNKNINTPLNELDEKTTLQIKVKELLKNNINIGSAYGILK